MLAKINARSRAVFGQQSYIEAVLTCSSINSDGAFDTPHTQPNPKPSLSSALSEPWRPQQANSCITACKTTHVCSDAQAGGRVAEIAGMVNQRGDERGDEIHQ